MPPFKQLPKKQGGRKRSKNSVEQIEKDVAEYLNLKKSAKRIETALAEIKSRLKTVVDEWPDNNDLLITPSGTRIVTVGDYELTQECRSSVTLKTNAAERIKHKHPELKKRLIETTEVVRMDRFETLVEQGLLSVRDVKALTNIEDSFAFKAKKK